MMTQTTNILIEKHPQSKRTVRNARLAALVLLVAGAIGASAENAAAQMRMPLPGAMRFAPKLIMPAVRGGSQLGWDAGRRWSMRQYGPTADPGRWPGLPSALGIRRR